MKFKFRVTGDDVRDYLFLTIGVLFYTIGWGAFMLPYQITVGGVAGISNIVYFITGIPIDVTYFLINACLMIVALKLLGWRFMVKTIYCIFAITFMLRIIQMLLKQPDGSLLQLMGPQESFMACIIGSSVCGIGLGFIFMQHGSTGGTDILAAIVNKYRDVSLGRVLTICDIVIVSSCYFIFYNWRLVVFGFCTLFVMYYVMDYFMDRQRHSVQFFIITKRYDEISHAINEEVHRGCTLLQAEGSYTHEGCKVVMCIARKFESNRIYDIINEIDPQAFVSQSRVVGVFGKGFSAIQSKKPKARTGSAHVAGKETDGAK
ncbi:MAG: YitT family protein [Muribaculaceae bacterium]